MGYNFGQIEIYYGRDKGGVKKRKKNGYRRKLRRALKNPDFVPVNGAYKGYQ